MTLGEGGGPQMASENTNPPKVAGSDPRHHSIMLRQMLMRGKYARADIELIHDTRARVLFEVTAEVLGGLTKAFRDYEENNEPA